MGIRQNADVNQEHDKQKQVAAALELLYAQYGARAFVYPDPLHFLYEYSAAQDREIVGMIASSLAFGNVRQIANSVRLVLDLMGSPAQFVLGSSLGSLKRLFKDFKHRYVGGAELSALMEGIRGAIEEYGSLQACFMSGFDTAHENVLAAEIHFVSVLNRKASSRNFLLPDPRAGSACKRLQLYLRWMVRQDAVDPGGWEQIPASKLIMPMDTHIFRVARLFGWTQRSQADMKAALEVTRKLKAVCPEDPVRYDFALTRLSMRGEEGLHAFHASCGE